MVRWETAMIRYALAHTDIGELGLAASERGLVGLLLPQPGLRHRVVAQFAVPQFTKDGSRHEPIEDPGFFADLASRLQSYARGDLITFDDVVLDLKGTPFQLAVWQATRAIPRGQTRSYKQIAEAVGRPGASRAVGAAMAANPVTIIIPCHRVVASDGGLCGFGGGLPLKQRLLALERGQQAF
jgi:O-6-methylguanine DNA methyltransferase